MDTKKLDIMCLAEVNKDLFEKINNYCSEKNNIKMVPSNQIASCDSKNNFMSTIL